MAGGAQSTQLTIDVVEERPSPTPPPSATPTEAATLEPIPTSEEPTPTPVTETPPETDITGLAEWLMALAVSFVTGWAALRVGAMRGQVRWGVRWGLATLIGGLLAYTYAVLQFPGSEWAFDTPYYWGLLLITFIGSLLGWGFGLIVRAASNSK